jgi:hypothetical protein
MFDDNYFIVTKTRRASSIIMSTLKYFYITWFEFMFNNICEMKCLVKIILSCHEMFCVYIGSSYSTDVSGE